MTKRKRPDLRTPMADRKYEPVDKPIIVQVDKGFQLPAKEPCKECPLARTAEPGALGGYTPEQYVEVLEGPADLACHMSPGFPDDRTRQRSCTGVAMFRANANLAPAGRSALDAMKEVGPNRELVFASLTEFLRHHGAEPKLTAVHEAHNRLTVRIVSELFREIREAGGGPEDVVLTLTSICAGIAMALERSSKGRVEAETWGQLVVENVSERIAEMRARQAARRRH